MFTTAGVTFSEAAIIAFCKIDKGASCSAFNVGWELLAQSKEPFIVNINPANTMKNIEKERICFFKFNSEYFILTLLICQKMLALFYEKIITLKHL